VMISSSDLSSSACSWCAHNTSVGPWVLCLFLSLFVLMNCFHF